MHAKGKKNDEFFRVYCSFSLSRIQSKLACVQPLPSRDLVWFLSIKHPETRSTKTSNKHTLILSVEERRKKTTVEHQKIEPCRSSCLVKFKGNWASYLNNLKSVRKCSNEFACLQSLHWIYQFKCRRRSNIYCGLWKPENHKTEKRKQQTQNRNTQLENRNTWIPKTETQKHKRKPNQKHKT